MDRMSEDGRLPKHIIDSYMQLHAHALGCMAEACSGLAATGGALQSLGRAFTGTLNLEAVMQALLRHPLAAVTPEVHPLPSCRDLQLLLNHAHFPAPGP